MDSFSLGHRIREIRMRKGITQIDLANGLCTPSMISQIESERARPSFKILSVLAERLDVRLEDLLSDTDLNLGQVSAFKMAKAMLASREYAAAIPLLEELIQEQRPFLPTTEIQFALAECYLHTERPNEAEKLFESVSEVAVLRQDHVLLAQVLKCMGQLEMNRKRYQLATFHFNKAIVELKKSRVADNCLVAELQHHLGAAYSRMGEISQAIACFNSSIEGYHSSGTFAIGHLYLQLSASYQQLTDYKRALEYAEKASAVFDVVDHTNQLAEAKLISATLKGQSGLLDEATVLLNDAITTFREMGDKEKEGVAHAELAKMTFENGELETAEEECRLARTMLPELHPYQAHVHRILGKIAKVRGKSVEAKRRFQMAADCFKGFGEAKEWDETMFEMAQIYLDTDDAAKAFAIMTQLRQFNHEALSKRGIAL